MNFAFVFSWGGAIPPDKDDIKAYFISQALIAKGHKVNWFGNTKAMFQTGTKEGITLKRLDPAKKMPRAKGLRFMLWVINQLIKEKVDYVYGDCWFFFYGQYHLIIPFQLACKLLGLRFISDLRDPYVEHEVATGNLRKGSVKERYLRKLAGLSYRLSDLLIVPSEEYRLHFSKSKNPAEIVPVYRGIDDSKFNLKVQGDRVRKALGLNDRFVIGWFGTMHAYRRINEIIIPMINETSKTIPNVYFIIGGDGPLKDKFLQLKKNQPNAPFTYLGPIPYNQIPEHIAACDLIICPISTEHEHGRYSLWLRYSESLAIGKPLVATNTEACAHYFNKLKGIVFVEDSLNGFIKGLQEVHAHYEQHHNLALQDAANFSEYTVKSSSHKIIDTILN